MARRPRHKGPCWLWTRATNDSGYGVVRTPRGLARSHRATYEALRGPIPAGMVLDHLCRVRACCNPWHLEPVTDLENKRRGARARKRAKIRAAKLAAIAKGA